MAESIPQISMPASGQQPAYDNDDYIAAGTGLGAAIDERRHRRRRRNRKAATPPADGEEKPSCRWCLYGKLADPWTLPQPDCLKSRNITIGGWLDRGIYGNQFAPNNGPVGLRGIGDGFTADQFWFYAERKTDTKGCGWDIGGRVDYVFGVEARKPRALATAAWTSAGTRRRSMARPSAALHGNRLQRSESQGRPLLHPDRLRSRAGAAELLLLALLLAHLRRAVHPHRRPGSLTTQREDHMVRWLGHAWDEGFGGQGPRLDVPRRFLHKPFRESDVRLVRLCRNAGRLNCVSRRRSGDLYYNCFIFTYKLTDKWTYIFEHDLGSNYSVNPTASTTSGTKSTTT